MAGNRPKSRHNTHPHPSWVFSRLKNSEHDLRVFSRWRHSGGLTSQNSGATKRCRRTKTVFGPASNVRHVTDDGTEFIRQMAPPNSSARSPPMTPPRREPTATRHHICTKICHNRGKTPKAFRIVPKFLELHILSIMGATPEATSIDGARQHWAFAPATGWPPCSSHASVAHAATWPSSQGPASALP